MVRKAVRDLHADYVDTKPIVFDWREHWIEEEWESFEAFRCEGCGAVVAPVMGEAHHSDVDYDVDCKGYVGCGEGPMMNYYYPMEGHAGDPVDDAKRLVDLPLCVVQVDGVYGLALTGGGMDLTWEICEAFMLLGYLPPTHFCSPPSLAGMKLTAKTRWIMAGCRRSLMIRRRWLESDLDRLRRLRKEMKGKE